MRIKYMGYDYYPGEILAGVSLARKKSIFDYSLKAPPRFGCSLEELKEVSTMYGLKRELDTIAALPNWNDQYAPGHQRLKNEREIIFRAYMKLHRKYVEAVKPR